VTTAAQSANARINVSANEFCGNATPHADTAAALTTAMQAAYAAQRAEIGPRGYEDRIFYRKAKARPDVRAITAEAERLLTLRENHRLNHIPEVPRVPVV